MHKSVLVATSDTEKAFALREMCKEQGFNVITTNNLSDCKKIINPKIDVVITDLNLSFSEEYDNDEYNWQSGIEIGLYCQKNGIKFVLIDNNGPECVLDLAKVAGWLVIRNYRDIINCL